MASNQGLHMKACAVLLMFVLAGSGGAHGQPIGGQRDLLVRFKAGLGGPAQKAIESGLGVTATEVPSLDAQLLRLKAGADSLEVLERARSDNRFEFVDIGIADYRKPLVPLAASVALDGATQQAVDRFMNASINSGSRLFRLRAPELAERMFARGFGTKDALPQPQSLMVDLADGESSVIVRRPTAEDGADGSTSWIGDVFRKGEGSGQTPAGSAQLTYRDGKLIGSISLGQTVYRVEPVADGVHAVTPVQRSRLPPDHPAGSSRPFVNRPKLTLPASPASSTQDAVVPSVSVAIGFTTAAAARAGDIALLETHLINQFNEASRASSIDVRLKAKGLKTFDFTETTVSSDLEGFKTGAVLLEARKWRRAMGANIAVLITTSDDACGDAGVIYAEPHTAYAVVSETCAISNFSFTHEVGHLFGARHDFETDPSDNPFPWGHGFATKNWRTVMSYPSACGTDTCPRSLRWSTPHVKLGGVKTGTLERHHDARVIQDTARTLMGYQAPSEEQ